LTAWVRDHGFRLLSPRSFALWRLVLNLKDFVAPEWAVKERSRPRRPAAAPPRMKMYIPLRRRGAGVGCAEPKDPPRTLTPSAPPERGFSGKELPMVTFYLEAVTPACQQALKLSRDQPLLSGYYLAGE